jgi:hypothetical protein
MYLDTGTMIGIIIALAACILTMVYSMYIINTQNAIIRRMNSANVAMRKRTMENQ